VKRSHLFYIYHAFVTCLILMAIIFLALDLVWGEKEVCPEVNRAPPGDMCGFGDAVAELLFMALGFVLVLFLFVALASYLNKTWLSRTAWLVMGLLAAYIVVAGVVGTVNSLLIQGYEHHMLVLPGVSILMACYFVLLFSNDTLRSVNFLKSSNE
jgi:hypothetical protein